MKKIKNKYLIRTLLRVLCIVYNIATILTITPASASSFDYNVNVKPTLSITLSSPTIALRLNPASLNFNTGNVDISVATNNLSGYKLYMGADGDTTNLVNTTDSNYYIETLPTSGTTNCAIISGGTGGCTESNFPINYWGYRIASGSNTNPDITDTTTGSNSRYFPYIPNTLINSTTSTTNNNTSTLTFAASADYAKPAGTYSLDLNFRTIPIITQTYMQDMTAEQCTETPTIVIDKRDEQFYTVRKIAGNCWMVDNLRFTGTIMDSTTTNISDIYTPEHPYIVNNATDFDEHNDYYDLLANNNNGEKCWSSYDSATGDGYIYACLHKGANDYTGGTTVWYNYAAATAGYITGLQNNKIAIYSICPSGWRLPNYDDMNNILGDTYYVDFNIKLAGQIGRGPSPFWNVGANAYWWSNKGATGTNRTRLGSNTDNLYTTDYDTNRGLGSFVRCVLSE